MKITLHSKTNSFVQGGFNFLLKIKCIIVLSVFFGLNNLSFAQTNDVALSITVDKAIAYQGDIVTLTLTLENEDLTNLTGLEVTNNFPEGLSYVSHLAPGTTTYNSTSGLWNVGAELSAATNNLSLTIIGVVDSVGLINGSAEVTAMDQIDVDGIPNNGVSSEDDYASICISVPVWICTQVSDEVILTAESGYSNYQWFRNGILISGATGETYTASLIGDYTYTVDGICPTSSCCPIIVEESCMDLALKKETSDLSPNPAMLNDVIQFDFTVYNQGTEAAYEIVVKDYIPAGLTFNIGDNTSFLTGNLNDWRADSTYLVDFLAAGDSASLKLFLTIDNSFPTENVVINQSEISFATNTDGGTVNVPDIDSEFDTDVNNDTVGGDNDINGNYQWRSWNIHD